MVTDVEQRLSAVAGANKTAIGAMVETPLGVMRAEEIARSSPRLTVLVMGTSDLTTDLRARHTRDRLPMLTRYVRRALHSSLSTFCFGLRWEE